MQLRKNIKEIASLNSSDTKETVAPGYTSVPLHKIKKSVAKNLKNALFGLGLMAGASNAMACTYNEYVDAPVDGNIDINKISELSEKGPVLSDSIYDGKTIFQAIDSVLGEMKANDLHPDNFLDNAGFQKDATLTVLPESAVTNNLIRAGQKYQLIYYKKDTFAYLLSFKSSVNDNEFVISVSEDGKSLSVDCLDKYSPETRHLTFIYDQSRDGGYAKIFDNQNNVEKFISADGHVLVHDGWKYPDREGTGVWKSGQEMKILSKQSPTDLGIATSLIGHNGLLNKYISKSPSPNFAPKNSNELMEIIKKLPSNNPAAYEEIIKTSVKYRPDPSSGFDFQFRHPDVTLAEGFADCDDYVVFALVWAKANGFKARVAWFVGGDNGHVFTRLENPQTGEVFVIDNDKVYRGESSYRMLVETMQKNYPGWRFHEEER